METGTQHRGNDKEDALEILHFGEDSHRMFGVLHRAVGKAHTGIVFCPSYGDEMVSSYASFARWAKELAAKGFSVLRYHPYGTGESDGTALDFTLDSAVSDAVAALNCLRGRVRVPRAGFMCLRFGGFVAVRAALRAHPDFLIMWSPVVNPRQYCRELMSLQLAKDLVQQRTEQVCITTQGMMFELEAGRPVDILGRLMSPEFYRQMSSSSWPDRPPAGDVLWLSRRHERAQVTPLVENWKAHGKDVEHQFFDEPPFWEDHSSKFATKFSAASVAWLQKKIHQVVNAA